MKDKFLIQNSVICLACGDRLVSYYHYDYVTCNCSNKTSCDGGLSYERCGGKDLELVKSDSVYSDAPFEVIRKVLLRGGRGINGDEELKYVALKDIDDEWLENIITYEEEYRPENKYLNYYKTEQKWRKKSIIEK